MGYAKSLFFPAEKENPSNDELAHFETAFCEEVHPRYSRKCILRAEHILTGQPHEFLTENGATRFWEAQA